MYIGTDPLKAASQPPEIVLAEGKKLNYTGPLERSVQLQKELPSLTSAESTSSFNSLNRSAVTSWGPNCIGGSHTYSVGKLTPGVVYKPWPYLTFTIGQFEGTIKGSGQICADGGWNGSITGSFRMKNEMLLGLSTGNWKEFTQSGVKYRYKFDFGLKFDAKPEVAAGGIVEGVGWNYTEFQFYGAVQVTVGGAITAPELEIQQYKLVNGSWKWVNIFDDVTFEVSALGQATFSWSYRYTCTDYDPQTPANKEKSKEWEEFRQGSISGKVGGKLKIKLPNNKNFESELYWSKTSSGQKVLLENFMEIETLDQSADKEVSQRPSYVP